MFQVWFFLGIFSSSESLSLPSVIYLSVLKGSKGHLCLNLLCHEVFIQAKAMLTRVAQSTALSMLVISSLLKRSSSMDHVCSPGGDNDC